MVRVSEISEGKPEFVHEIREEPYACVVSSQFRRHYCSACFKKSLTELKRCSRCHFLYFCDSQCQKTAWPDHKDECRNLERTNPRKPTDMARLMARIIFKKSSSQSNEGRTGRSFDDLMSHANEIQADSSRSDHFVSLAFVLKEFIGEEVLPPPSELLEIFGKIVVNAFSILDTDLNPIGTGLYLRLSELDHSCSPDSVVVFDGPTAILRPLKKSLDLSDLSQIRMSYIDLLAPCQERRRQLKEQYYFDCDCSACQSRDKDMQMEAYKCSSCSGPVNSVQADLSCEKCQKPFTEMESGMICVQKTKWTLEKLENLRKAGEFSEIFEECQQLMEVQKESLYVMNVYHVRTMDFMFDACIETKRWTQAAHLGQQIALAYREFYPANYPNLVLHLAKLGKILLFLEKTDRNTEMLLDETLKMCEVCYGNNHPIFEEVEQNLVALREEMKVKMSKSQFLEN